MAWEEEGINYEKHNQTTSCQSHYSIFNRGLFFDQPAQIHVFNFPPSLHSYPYPPPLSTLLPLPSPLYSFPTSHLLPPCRAVTNFRGTCRWGYAEI